MDASLRGEKRKAFDTKEISKKIPKSNSSSTKSDAQPEAYSPSVTEPFQEAADMAEADMTKNKIMKPKVEVVSCSWIRLSWDPDSPFSKDAYYKMWWKKDETKEFEPRDEKYKLNDIILSNLKPDTQYQFCVKYICGDDEGPLSESSDPVRTLKLEWTDEQFQEQTKRLFTGCVEVGSSYIYPLWKFLLRRWFSEPNTSVYIVTPFFDSKRLIDICEIIIDKRKEIKMNATQIYVRHDCDKYNNKTISDIKKEALKTIDKTKHTYVNDGIYPCITTPSKYFHAKFIGCTNGDDAEVLVTSANFQHNHFGFHNMESVMYKEMSKQAFMSNFVAPIQNLVECGQVQT